MKKGFTLVELIIYIAIIGLIITAYVSFVISVSSVRVKSYVVQEVTENARFAIETIVKDIKTAEAVITPTQGNTSVALELNMPNTADNTIYSLTGNILNQTIGASIIPITNTKVNVTSLEFINLAKVNKKSNIKINITLEYTIQGGVDFIYSKSFSTSVSLRK